MWPAVREASLSGDNVWIKKSLRHALLICCGVSLAISIPIAFFFPAVNSVWTGGDVSPSGFLVAAVFVWTNILVVGNALATFLNGLRIIRLQVWCALVMAILNVGLSIALTQAVGPSGVVLGSIIAYSIAVLLPFAFVLPRVLSRRFEEIHQSGTPARA